MRMSALARPLTLAMALSAGALAFASPKTAEACGGCFAPPIANTVVAYHRMILSVSTSETTLYDQIQYSGSPDSFAWVLPIRGEAKVGLSADIVFQALDQTTTTSILPPPRNCPTPPVCYNESSAKAGAPQASGGASLDNGVTVLKEETVGPYETVQLSAKSPGALGDWLKGHGYNIPDDIKPLIESYVTEQFDFLALKLVPGQGITSMRPVRVTTKGAVPSLPLRMVAAGSGASVGVTLWVVGDGRWEPQTFPSFVIPASDITWKWAESRSDYDLVRKAKVDALGGAAWETESSADYSTSLVPNLIAQQRSFGGRGGPTFGVPNKDPFYDAVTDQSGAITKTAQEVEAEDMAALFQKKTLARVTRMRSDLPRASLATDLVLQASSDQSVVATFRQLTKEEGEPTCPVYEGCKYIGVAPRSKAKAQAEDQCGTSGAFCSGGGCSFQPFGTGDGDSRLGFWALAAVGLVVAGARRSARRS